MWLARKLAFVRAQSSVLSLNYQVMEVSQANHRLYLRGSSNHGISPNDGVNYRDLPLPFFSASERVERHLGVDDESIDPQWNRAYSAKPWNPKLKTLTSKP